MEDILTGYEVNQATWFYHSLVLILAVFFKFNRLWSLRNFDLILLLSLSPGLILVKLGDAPDYVPAENGFDPVTLGYGWLFAVTAVLLLRLLFDASFKRRPRLEQNMNVQGMLFLTIAAFAFLLVKAVTESPPGIPSDPKVAVSDDVRAEGGRESPNEPSASERYGAKTGRPDATIAGQPSGASEKPVEGAETDSKAEGQSEVAQNSTKGTDGKSKPNSDAPNTPTLTAVQRASEELSRQMSLNSADSRELQLLAARITAIVAHLAVILGLIVVGKSIFGDLQLGLSMGTIYLLLPCTAYDVHRANHVIPTAFVVWSFVAYRRPIISGALLGLSCGAVFFPVFLLPLWISFYRRKGAFWFIGSLLITSVVLVATLKVTGAYDFPYTEALLGPIANLLSNELGKTDTNGFWGLIADSSYYRLPVFVAFVIMVFVLTVRRGQRTLEHLIADSTAVIVATQLWYAQTGGRYLLWYLPLLLLVVFRPRLMHLLPPEAEAEKTATVKLPNRQDQGTLSGAQQNKHVFR